MKTNRTTSALVLSLVFLFAAYGAQAQHCVQSAIPGTTDFHKIKDGTGFIASYSLPCIVQGGYSEIAIPFKVYNTIIRGRNDDAVYRMRIDAVSNLPAGMCWATDRSDNVFEKGEAGTLTIRGITSDNSGQYVLKVTLSFDTENKGEFNRAQVDFNDITQSGKMILRVSNGNTACERLDYNSIGNTAGNNVATK
jgi:hypothetical protein